jgi:3-oxoacyl-[acyl-carrier protein] reductase
VTIGTRGVITPLPNMVEYSAAKAALINATGALAQELAGSGITANTVSPGVILTPGLEAMFLQRAHASGDHRDWDAIEAGIVSDYAPNPIGRLGRPEDIADAVSFLVSTRASYISGATLRVDGGITATTNP